MTTLPNNIRSFSLSLTSFFQLVVCYWLYLCVYVCSCLYLIHSRTVLLYLSWTCRSNFFNFSARTNFHKIKAFAKAYPTICRVSNSKESKTPNKMKKQFCFFFLSFCIVCAHIGGQALRKCVAFALSILCIRVAFIVEWEFVLHSHYIYVQFVVNHFGWASSNSSNSHRQRCWLKMTT